MARGSKTYTLRRASSVVFALISVLPLLLFAYTLYALDVLHHVTAQIGLGSALVLSMIGFYIYSVMMSRLSEILRDIEAEEDSPTTTRTTQGPVVTMAVEPGPSGPVAASHAASASRQIPAPPSDRPAPSRARAARPPAGAAGSSFPAWPASQSSRGRTQARRRTWIRCGGSRPSHSSASAFSWRCATRPNLSRAS